MVTATLWAKCQIGNNCAKVKVMLISFYFITSLGQTKYVYLNLYSKKRQYANRCLSIGLETYKCTSLVLKVICISHKP